ncbi:unnamed protein product [Phytophthora fragariaefolia]|uniref:Unnamed protein product n=1 Tax=Phytophthora fragariaefolia TaxID=1490495 RepID=A0A9W7DBC2_9STRA|nr:unnamed protein product [Phytophthora fragariaefolia]
MGQVVCLPAPSSFATYPQAASATAGRARKTQGTDATSSATRDVLDLRPRSPARKGRPSSGSAQINDSMSSACDDGGRDAGSVTTEIDRPPKLPKGLDESPTSGVSESDPKEVEPEITMPDTNDTLPLAISEPDKCESIEGKEEAENEGTDDEILSALSRSRSSLRRRGSLTSDRGTLQSTIDVSGDGESSSGSPSGNSEDRRRKRGISYPSSCWWWFRG